MGLNSGGEGLWLTDFKLSLRGMQGVTERNSLNWLFGVSCKVRWGNLEHGVTWNTAHSSAPYSGTGTVRLTLWDGIGRYTSALSYRGLQVSDSLLCRVICRHFGIPCNQYYTN